MSSVARGATQLEAGFRFSDEGQEMKEVGPHGKPRVEHRPRRRAALVAPPPKPDDMAKLMSVKTELPAGASAKERVEAATKQDRVVVFSKTWCAFCMRVKDTLAQYNVDFVVYELDKFADGAAAAGVQDALGELTKVRTVPAVFVLGEYLGGCDMTKELERRGDLQIKLDKVREQQGRKFYSARDPFALETFVRKPDHPTRAHMVAKFPDAVPEQAVRIGGVLSMLVCIVCVALHWWGPSKWIALGLFVDYLLRFVHGSSVSPIGITALMLMGSREPKLKPGVSKQFATAVGTTFAGLGALSFFLSDDGRVGGSVVLGILAVCAGMEGLLNFCLGCYFFGWGVRLGLLPKSLYHMYIDSRAEKIFQWQRQHVFENPPVPDFKSHVPEGCESTKADLRVRRRSMPQRWEDFDPVRHIQGSDFGSALASAALALMYKLAGDVRTMQGAPVRDVPDDVWWALGIFAAVHYCALLLLYAVKAFRYPRKIVREWHHSMFGGSMLFVLLCPQLLAALVADDHKTFAEVLFWLTAPLMTVLSFVKLAEGLVKPQFEMQNGAHWFIPPMVNAVTALVVVFVFDPDLSRFDAGAVVHSRWQYEAGWLWLSFAGVMWFGLWPTTWAKGVSGNAANWRTRPMAFFWVACPAVLGLAYFFLTQSFDSVFRFLFMAGFTLWFVLAFTFKDLFFTGPKFDMVDWAFSFPTTALAMAAIVYDSMVNSDLTNAIALVAMVVASLVFANFALHTVAGLVRREVWRPMEREGPMMFMMMTHQGLRAQVPKLVKLSKALGNGKEAEAHFITELVSYENTFIVHSTHEEEVIFPMLDRITPGVGQQLAHAEHEHEDILLKNMMHACRAMYEGGPVFCTKNDEGSFEVDVDNGVEMELDKKDIIDYLQRKSVLVQSEMNTHLDNEENVFPPMIAKCMLPTDMRQINRDCWDITPNDRMAAHFVWAMRHIPLPVFRMRFVKCWFMSSPERAQTVGVMAYRACAPHTWAYLEDHMPEMIPRGLPGWRPL